MRFPIPIVVFATLAAALPQVDDLKSLESSLAKTLTRGKPLPSPAVNGPKADAEKELPRLQTTKAKKTTKIPIEIPIPTVTMPKGGPEKLAPSISTGKVPPAVATSKPAKGKGKGDLNGEIASLEAEVAKLINGPAYASLESYASKKGTDGAKTWDLTPTSKLTKSKPTGESSSKDPSTLKKTTRKDDKAEETKTKSKEERQDKQMATFEQYGRSAVSAMSEKQQKPTLAPREDKSWATLCEPFEASDDTPDVPTSHLVERDETDDEMAIAKAAGLKCYASCKHWYRVACEFLPRDFR